MYVRKNVCFGYAARRRLLCGLEAVQVDVRQTTYLNIYFSREREVVDRYIEARATNSQRKNACVNPILPNLHPIPSFVTKLHTILRACY